MPLLQKSPTQPSQPNSQVNLTSDSSTLLAQLLGVTAAGGFGTESRRGARAARAREARYDRAVRLVATTIGVGLCAGAWLVGAYYSLAWLASLGLELAQRGLAPIELLLAFGSQDQILSAALQAPSWGTVALAWAIPLSLTVAEVGFDPGRARGRASRVLWMLILGLDAATTALGLQPTLGAVAGEAALGWLLAVVVGLLLAIVPEKLARRLVLENIGE